MVYLINIWCNWCLGWRSFFWMAYMEWSIGMVYLVPLRLIAI